MNGKKLLPLMAVGGLALWFMSKGHAAATTTSPQPTREVVDFGGSGGIGQLHPERSEPLTIDHYEPVNTSYSDLQANIAWGRAQGFRLVSIENNVDGDPMKYKAVMVRP